VSVPQLPHVCDAILLDAPTIASRVAELASEIVADHPGEELRLVTVLRGGLFFLTDLARAIDAPLTLDFMAVSPYTPGKGGVVRVTKDLDDDIEDATVILVEDVIDTGLTVNYVRSLLRARAPRRLEICALLDKNVRRIADVPVAYRGFRVPDRFLVGYGLDLAGRYRNLPYIATMRDEAVGV
jgi:hypoxanthine phosphoribosyltransferase